METFSCRASLQYRSANFSPEVISTGFWCHSQDHTFCKIAFSVKKSTLEHHLLHSHIPSKQYGTCAAAPPPPFSCSPELSFVHTAHTKPSCSQIHWWPAAFPSEKGKSEILCENQGNSQQCVAYMKSTYHFCSACSFPTFITVIWDEAQPPGNIPHRLQWRGS